MGAVTPNELARMWAQEQLSTEHAVGQMLQQLVTMQTTLERQGQTIAQLRAQVADLSTRITSTVIEQSGQLRRKSRG